MSKHLPLFLLLLLVVLITNCQKEVIEPEVQYIESTYFGDCFLSHVQEQEHIVIRTQAEYEDYFDTKRFRGGNIDCSKAEPTDIDFNSFTLIGTETYGGGCRVEYSRNIKQEGNKTLTYYIHARYEGGCMMLIHNMHWVLVPKLKKKTEVVFEITEEHVI
ncbi:MAG: hypothetical protein JXR19_07145 [Bacteroidia bacterium]